MKNNLMALFGFLVLFLVGCEKPNPRLENCILKADDRYDECVREGGFVCSTMQEMEVERCEKRYTVE